MSLPPRFDRPGRATALPQTPDVWPTTNTYGDPLSTPAAAQLPAPAHEIEVTSEPPLGSMFAIPGTSIALPQTPFLRLTTKASALGPGRVDRPPAAQLPGVVHESAVSSANPSTLS